MCLGIHFGNLDHTTNQFSSASSLPSKSKTESRNFIFILQETELSNPGRLPQSTPSVDTPLPQLNSVLRITLKQAPESWGEGESTLRKRGAL